MIRHVLIERFWEQYKIDWTLHPDVNILVGINGSGKSTFLRIIDRVLSGGEQLSLDLYRYLPDNYVVRVEGDGVDINVRGNESGHWQYSRRAHYFMSTFDEVIHEKKALERALSPLAAQLDAVIFNTRELSLNGYRLKATETPDMSLRIGERLQQWLKMVNDFYATTNKSLEIQASDVYFRKANGEKLSLDQLSSGEKQLLIILTGALVQDQQPFVLLMDEPEISLDIDWQFKLINTIRKINPNCQLIIATHSPGIFGDGWSDKIVLMDQLLRKIS